LLPKDGRKAGGYRNRTAANPDERKKYNELTSPSCLPPQHLRRRLPRCPTPNSRSSQRLPVTDPMPSIPLIPSKPLKCRRCEVAEVPAARRWALPVCRPCLPKEKAKVRAQKRRAQDREEDFKDPEHRWFGQPGKFVRLFRQQALV
jgi:hypothetical protein